MDKPSQVLAQSLPEGVHKSFRALDDHSDVPRTTLQHRARGRRSKEEKAQSQHSLPVGSENPFKVLGTTGCSWTLRSNKVYTFNSLQSCPPTAPSGQIK